MVASPENAPASKASATKKHLYLIDAYGFLFRAYHSMPPLTRPDGTPVGGVYGFTNMLLKLQARIASHHNNSDIDYYAAVIFDAGQKTFRNDLYPDYKANRPPPPEDLKPQFPLVKEAAEAMGLPGIAQVGYEADDIIATFARQAEAAGMEVTIVSSDKDLMQLVGENIRMFDAAKERDIGPGQVEEKFGVGPEKVIDVLALMGDSSDNVPGVPGIGPKTAAELIQTYGDLDSVLARAEEVKQNKRRESLIAHAEDAKMSRELVTLCDTVELEESVEDLALRPPDPEKLLTFLRAQDFKALITRVEKETGATAPPAEKQERAPAAAPEIPKEQNYVLIEEKQALHDWVAAVKETGRIALAMASDGNEPVGLAYCAAPGQACYVPLVLENGGTQGDLLEGGSAAGGLPFSEVISVIHVLQNEAGTLKIGHDVKRNSAVLAPHQGIILQPIDDVMVMSYVLDGAKVKHELESLAQQHLDWDVRVPEEIAKAKTPLAEQDQAALSKLFCARADATLALHQLFRQRLFEEKMLTLYETIERPLISVLAKMEASGVKVDEAELATLSKDFETQMIAEEKETYKLAGEEFNIGSPKQLGEILFDKMGIEGGKKSKKTGAYSTDGEVLETLAAEGHTIADHILRWRMLSKLKGTYTDALAKHIDAGSGRIHSTFAMAVTSTGRLSSVDPNLQNIPIRTEEGKSIRRAFVAEEGNKLISADYSQIELRLVAHVAGVEALKQAFAEGQDIHAATASQVFGVPLEQIDSEHRRRAKAINFGILYGLSAFGLARQLGIPRGEAKEYIEQYFMRYPEVQGYLESTKEYAREHGFVMTLFGRKCFMPGINDKNPARRQFAERAAINAPLQGTAADIIKRAMIRLPAAFEKEGLSAQMVLQIHDELLVETPKNEAEAAAALIKQVMEEAAHLDVPLTVEAAIGENWGEIH